MNRCSVAQVANLLYRRLLIGEALERRTASGLATRDTADTAVCATPPDPSQVGSKCASAPCQFPCWEGLGVGSCSQCMRKSERKLLMNRNVGQASRLPRRRSQ